MSDGFAWQAERTDAMGPTRESITDEAATDGVPAFIEPSDDASRHPACRIEERGLRDIGLFRILGLVLAFSFTIFIPVLSMIVLLVVKPVFPLSEQPVAALLFALTFAYTVACLLALGELTARPLTPRRGLRRPKASVFVAGAALSLIAPAVVAVTALPVANTLLGKILVCLQAALCAGAFAACLITSVRLYRTLVEQPPFMDAPNPSADPDATNGGREIPPSASGESPKPWPAALLLRLQNGFDRGTVRSLIGMGSVSCAAGIGVILLVSPALGATASYGIGFFLLAGMALLGLAAIRSDCWMKIALGQWIGLLIGLNAGYALAFQGAVGFRPDAFFLILPFALVAIGVPLMVSHPPHRANGPSHSMFPLPEQTVSNEAFCSKAADAFRLTPREEETLLLVLEGLEAHEIAEELEVTTKTAKSYVRKVCRKVSANDVDGMVDALDAWWQREGSEPASA